MRGAGSVYNKVDSFKFLSKVIGSCMMRFEPEPQWLLRRSIWPGLADSLSVHVVVPSLGLHGSRNTPGGRGSFMDPAIKSRDDGSLDIILP